MPTDDSDHVRGERHNRRTPRPQGIARPGWRPGTGGQAIPPFAGYFGPKALSETCRGEPSVPGVRMGFVEAAFAGILRKWTVRNAFRVQP